MKWTRLIPVFSGIFLLSMFSGVSAQTGTRISKESNYPENVIWFSEPSEIVNIRQLLQEGKSQAAIDRARTYAASLEHVSGVEARIRYYFALNALCSALAANGNLQEAIETCNKAIGIYASRWQAFNNRGTAYYLSRRYDLALEDYRQALTLLSESEEKTEIIQHNIELAESRK